MYFFWLHLVTGNDYTWKRVISYTLKTEAADSSENSVNFFQNTRYHILEKRILQNFYCQLVARYIYLMFPLLHVSAVSFGRRQGDTSLFGVYDIYDNKGTYISLKNTLLFPLPSYLFTCTTFRRSLPSS